MYVYGNVVPKQEPVQEPRRQAHERPRRKESPQVQRNRRRAMGMNPGYVVFLSIAAVLCLVICVNYVKMQSRLTGY